jgi:hypothetical protein
MLGQGGRVTDNRRSYILPCPRLRGLRQPQTAVERDPASLYRTERELIFCHIWGAPYRGAQHMVVIPNFYGAHGPFGVAR